MGRTVLLLCVILGSCAYGGFSVSQKTEKGDSIWAEIYPCYIHLPIDKFYTASLTITNQTDDTLAYGDSFSVQMLLNEKWQKPDLISGGEEVLFNAARHYILPHQKINVWTGILGQIISYKEGKYRYVKQVEKLRTQCVISLYAEFEVVDSGSPKRFVSGSDSVIIRVDRNKIKMPIRETDRISTSVLNQTDEYLCFDTSHTIELYDGRKWVPLNGKHSTADVERNQSKQIVIPPHRAHQFTISFHDCHNEFIPNRYRIVRQYNVRGDAKTHDLYAEFEVLEHM